ncbi:restriction endonuclease subunit S [Bacteroides xylanisolvens]|uniref:restriction endonuclease subunit S n=1 Tax=Bacteroides xylanisolvens TaxID=371601 RepID=UPI001CDCC0B5|nr:restriction endonuclease subunit S [Bacteroides xylanisolvens]MCA4653145.1 restriction endonuclease subunit S [Bacteroides xylanisolvens]MCA4667682.1 restriction endonuclease subunit S [Bacteroides xylanisolvens]
MTTTTNNEHKKLNVPNLRFKEFQGEWEKYKLSEICTFFSGGTPSSSNKDFYGEDIAFIRSGELHADRTELFITQAGFDNSSAKMVEVGDLLLAMYGATSGDISISKIKGAINQAILCIRTKQNKKFTESVWNKHVSKILRKYLQGGQGNLSADIVKGISFSFPPLKEQGKIANLMSLLDERIATQNKIIEDLKKLKSAIIDYAISSLNADFMKFGSLYETAGEGGTPTTSNASFYDNGKIPFVKIDDLKQKYLVENKDFITELGLQKSSAWLVPTHSILFSNGATIGEITITTYPVCTKQGILGIVPKSNIDVEFLYYFMSSSYFNKAVSRIVTEGTMKTAYLKDINNILCPIPPKENQQEIAKMPSALNSKIDYEQSILKLFYAQKQYLLCQMFI